VALDFFDQQTQDRNYTRLKESNRDSDYYMCADNGLILSMIQRKREKLNVFEQFMKWANLRRAYVKPQGIKIDYKPSRIIQEDFYSSTQLI
jgi:hypothetical protein